VRFRALPFATSPELRHFALGKIAFQMVDHFESVSQRLGRDPDDPLERPAQVQDRLDRPRNGKHTKEQNHRYGDVSGCEQAETHEKQAQPEQDHKQQRNRDS